jgi:flagellar biosynthetic protein FliO
MDAIQPIAAVVLVLTLLGGALFFLKKRGAASFHLPGSGSRRGGSRRMEVIERVALGPQHALHMVRVGDRTVVVATAPSSCRLLCETDTVVSA